jgi:hypothetical protein
VVKAPEILAVPVTDRVLEGVVLPIPTLPLAILYNAVPNVATLDPTVSDVALILELTVALPVEIVVTLIDVFTVVLPTEILVMTVPLEVTPLVTTEAILAKFVRSFVSDIRKITH